MIILFFCLLNIRKAMGPITNNDTQLNLEFFNISDLSFIEITWKILILTLRSRCSFNQKTNYQNHYQEATHFPGYSHLEFEVGVRASQHKINKYPKGGIQILNVYKCLKFPKKL